VGSDPGYTYLRQQEWPETAQRCLCQFRCQVGMTFVSHISVIMFHCFDNQLFRDTYNSGSVY
jgi:hypothetical protein